MVAGPAPAEPLPPDSFRVKLMDHRYALRADAGGPARPIPESLVKLWRSGQVGQQDLPRLLAALEPRLEKPADYYESSADFIRRWGNRLLAVVALAGLAIPPVRIAALSILLICIPIELIYSSQARRRARQGRWALSETRTLVREGN